MKVDAIVRSIDSIVAQRTRIEEVIVRHVSDQDEIYLLDHYIFDTATKILYEVICDEKGFDLATIYYDDKKIIKVIVTDTTSIGPYKCEYYIRNDSLVSTRTTGIRPKTHLWEAGSVIPGAKSYLEEFETNIPKTYKRED